MTVQILTGDCRVVMAEMDAESIDAIVCDPPYELGFMGKGWDKAGVAFDPVTWGACLRVLKPGGHLLAFGGTRTFHRMTVAIEDAGFEIKDCLMWLQGQGFPKHKSLLKPGWEPIILGKKRGAGVLQIDACRLEGAPPSVPQPSLNSPTGQVYGFKTGEGRNGQMSHATGRWPANVILDETAAAMLDEQTGERPGCKSPSTAKPVSKFRPDQGQYMPQGPIYGDTGGASRFFYTAKASRSERNKGLDGMPERAIRDGGSEFGKMTMWNGENGDEAWRAKNPNKPAANHHPTVKPVDLMQWLVRLVTPPGGIVLDPFMGSGSTGIAADREGFSFIGIEQNPEYAEIARRRIIGDAPLFAEVESA